jgi:hypothetical protein
MNEPFGFAIMAVLIFIFALLVAKLVGDNEVSEGCGVIAIILASCALLWTFWTVLSRI